MSEAPGTSEEGTERFWWAAGPDGWGIETWNGEPARENVVCIGYAYDLADADFIVDLLNELGDPTLSATSVSTGPTESES